jgi:hypothetical protein
MPKAGQAIKPRVALGKRPDDCWRWLGQATPDGHGKLTFHGQEVMARRWLWEQLFGPIPKGLIVYSTCGARDCINPHHMACGYMADARRNACDTKLVPADIARVRAAKDGATAATAGILADQLGCSPNTIRDIWRGTTWARRRRHTAPNQRRENARG